MTNFQPGSSEVGAVECTGICDVGTIEAAFRNALQACDIRVSIADGRLRLCGCVRSWAQRDEARHLAWAIPGIIAVEDWLRVVG